MKKTNDFAGRAPLGRILAGATHLQPARLDSFFSTALWLARPASHHSPSIPALSGSIVHRLLPLSCRYFSLYRGSTGARTSPSRQAGLEPTRARQPGPSSTVLRTCTFFFSPVILIFRFSFFRHFLLQRPSHLLARFSPVSPTLGTCAFSVIFRQWTCAFFRHFSSSNLCICFRHFSSFSSSAAVHLLGPLFAHFSNTLILLMGGLPGPRPLARPGLNPLAPASLDRQVPYCGLVLFFSPPSFSSSDSAFSVIFSFSGRPTYWPVFRPFLRHSGLVHFPSFFVNGLVHFFVIFRHRTCVIFSGIFRHFLFRRPSTF